MAGENDAKRIFANSKRQVVERTDRFALISMRSECKSSNKSTKHKSENECERDKNIHASNATRPEKM
jgi:hypothetical protein